MCVSARLEWSYTMKLLVQVAPIRFTGILAKDFFGAQAIRIDTGFFGINQHWGCDLPINNITRTGADPWMRTRTGHRNLCQLIKRDGYQNNRSCLFTTAVIAGDDLTLKSSVVTWGFTRVEISKSAAFTGNYVTRDSKCVRSLFRFW